MPGGGARNRPGVPRVGATVRGLAFKMLFGDQGKYLGLVFGVAFAVLLITQQSSMFVGIMERTASLIYDAREADVWVMDPSVAYVETVRPLKDTELARVRGVPGVLWATPLFKGETILRPRDGNMTAATVIGVDNSTLIGVPRRMILGDIESLRQPDAIVMDQVGYRLLWPGSPLQLGRSLEINDRRAVIVGIVDASPTFAFLPKLFTRYSQALEFTSSSRNRLSFILARTDREDPKVLAARIATVTGLQARSSSDFARQTMEFYVKNTAIPINFGVVITLGVVVGATVVGLTFSMFIRDNLRQYAVLKAIGATDAQLVGMVMLQATVVGLAGYGIGLAIAAAFFSYLPQLVLELRGFYLPWQIAAAVALATALIVVVAGVIGMRRVLVLDPATVFRTSSCHHARQRPVAAVHCRGLVKWLGRGPTRTRVLCELEFVARAGELTLLVGPSGCGKTTLISTIAGLLRADGGEVRVLDTLLGALRGARLARFRAQNLGLVFQTFNLLPALTALENITVPLLVRGVAAKRARSAAGDVLERLQLGGHRHKLPNELSGGQQQRVAIGRALVHEPRLLICDEPTASLDSETGSAVIRLLRDTGLAPQRAIIIVTHDDRILPYADRIVRMTDGRILATEDELETLQ